MRRTRPDQANRVVGKDAGRRCCSSFTGGWRWTVYESPATGLELTLDDAKATFEAALR